MKNLILFLLYIIPIIYRKRGGRLPLWPGFLLNSVIGFIIWSFVQGDFASGAFLADITGGGPVSFGFDALKTLNNEPLLPLPKFINYPVVAGFMYFSGLVFWFLVRVVSMVGSHLPMPIILIRN